MDKQMGKQIYCFISNHFTLQYYKQNFYFFYINYCCKIQEVVTTKLSYKTSIKITLIQVKVKLQTKPPQIPVWVRSLE